VSKEAMDIDFIGPSVISQLFELGLVKTPIDFYKLTFDDFLKLDLVKEKSASNMYNSIQESKKRPLSRFVTALSIRHVGKETAEILVNEFSSIEELMNADLESLSKVEGIGEKILSGEATLEELSAYALEKKVTTNPDSGRQEYLQTIVNQILF
jgi:DNA ligase (NAD+)